MVQQNPIILCGSMFDKNIRRHRHFESNIPLIQPKCRHDEQERNSPGYRTIRYHSGKPVEHIEKVVSVFGRGNGYGPGETDLWRSVMGMPWASKDGLREAIPPYYTTFIGLQLMGFLNNKKGAGSIRPLPCSPMPADQLCAANFAAMSDRSA